MQKTNEANSIRYITFGCLWLYCVCLFILICDMKRSWTRRELSYAHVHCSCTSCNGLKATSVELRHWQWQNSIELADPSLHR